MVAEPVALELGRPQLEDEVAQLLERLLRELLQPARLCTRAASGSTSSSPPAASAVSVSANSFWRHHVVQLERQPVALLEDRELAAALVQARVLDRDRGVGGEHLDQLLVGRRELVAPSLSVR